MASPPPPLPLSSGPMVSELVALLATGPEDLGFVPAAAPASAPYFMLAERHVGIPVGLLTALFDEANAAMQAARRRTEAEDAGKAMADATCGVLVVNALHVTAWNARKRLVRAGRIAVAEELEFNRLVLQLHPKSDPGWSHRRWCLRHLRAEGCDWPAEIVAAELQLCTRVADIYPRNFYAWSHRQWTLTRCTDRQWARRDRADTAAWISGHVSDNCGYHHAFFLLSLLLPPLSPLAGKKKKDDDDDEEARAIAEWCDEARSTARLLSMYPEHEAPWLHLRHVLLTLARFEQHAEVASVLAAVGSSATTNVTQLQALRAHVGAGSSRSLLEGPPALLAALAAAAPWRYTLAAKERKENEAEGSA